VARALKPVSARDRFGQKKPRQNWRGWKSRDESKNILLLRGLQVADRGLNYVSCSPYRVPVARLAAAQAAVSDLKAAKKK